MGASIYHRVLGATVVPDGQPDPYADGNQEVTTGN